MKINSTSAATDNDFINHLVETRLPMDTLITTLRTIFLELGLTAIVHPLVYENEVMHSNERVKTFFEEKIVQKVEFLDIFESNDTKKKYYIFLIRELFKSLRNDKFSSLLDEDILTRWQKRSSFGEVHSIAMCLTCGCNIFLSDDGDSKKLAQITKNKFPNSIRVYNRKEVIDKHLHEGETTIKRNLRNVLTHN